MSQVGDLPDYTADQFALIEPPECDLIMKGGVTSGVVYPYAVLEIATKYRFRSLGGTSAGAIAAAFAAAAEYGRQNGRPESFLLLKHYCDELPAILPTLFQPSPELKPALDSVMAAMKAGSPAAIIREGLRASVGWAALGALVLALPGLLAVLSGFLPFQAVLVSISLYALLLGLAAGGAAGLAWGVYRWARRKYIDPVRAFVARFAEHNFGFCTGLTQPGNTGPAVTDWLHRALQHIAFGDPDHPQPLTFGNLWGGDPEHPVIDLKVVTTNLSMRRPHTLPRMGVASGFRLPEWQRLFPADVMAYLQTVSKKWQIDPKSLLFPKQADVPVLVAIRMSLSFPLLFSAVPMRIEDVELPSILRRLGGIGYTRIRTVHFSDGGISSNFPIHMFDAPLPTRPTFAFSLEDLLWNADEVEHRVALPEGAEHGMGVQIAQIRSLTDFGWSILSSAKDWQDQLLSEITGQRERIARIYLTSNEGGLNLNMSPETSRALMFWGYEAGKKFKEGGLDFDEHKWRRLLALYQNLRSYLLRANTVWSKGYAQWYESYLRDTETYNALSLADKRRIKADLDALFEISSVFEAEPLIRNPDEKFPRKIGVLKTSPKY